MVKGLQSPTGAGGRYAAVKGYGQWLKVKGLYLGVCIVPPQPLELTRGSDAAVMGSSQGSMLGSMVKGLEVCDTPLGALDTAVKGPLLIVKRHGSMVNGPWLIVKRHGSMVNGPWSLVKARSSMVKA